MAKKGGVQQLQAELNTDEAFEAYLDKYPDALLVMDIYSDWCGPCLGVVNALRKIKLELGGDKLQLSVCKSDNITRLQRFRKKSEPTWLFVRDHKSVNLMFGSHVPKLMDLIKHELHLVDTPISRRDFIDIEDLHPEEQRREQIKNDARRAIELKERLEREKKRRDYLMFCTDAIMENLPDVGVSVFGPQVNRDMYKKINEPADGLKMQCKDRRFAGVTKEDFDVVNFACHNPLSDDVIDILTQNEILICFWKISDEANHSVPFVMNHYVTELTKKVVEPADEYNSEERVIPPIIDAIKIKVEYEVDDDFICPPDDDEPEKKEKVRVSEKQVMPEEEIMYEEEYEESDEGEGGQGDDQGSPGMDMPAMDFDMGDDGSVNGEEEEYDEGDLEPPPRKTCIKTVKMPAVWVPNDERTHAALIYVFFRKQTLPFLLPDPPPEPPHVIMAFDTYKKRDLISIAERNKNDIPMYGFFSSDDAEEAKFIANSAQKYAHHPQSASDKLVFKVNKHTSHMMLSLATYGATYVSPNPIVGKDEALKFFPETYRTAEQDRLDAIEAQKAQAQAEGEKGKDAKAEPGKAKESTVPIQEEAMEEMEYEGYDMDEDFGGEGGEGGEGAEEGEGEYDMGEGPEEGLGQGEMVEQAPEGVQPAEAPPAEAAPAEAPPAEAPPAEAAPAEAAPAEAPPAE